MNKEFNILGLPITEGISVFSACKNRAKNLEKSIESWINCKDVDEIIVVDWDSNHKIIYEHPKIKIARVDSEPWSLTKSFNLSARLCTKNKICKLDADYVIDEDFLYHHPLNKKMCYSGNWELARNDNERYLNGFLYLNREDFMKVNGYNERLQKYGFDDTDIKQRLLNLHIKNFDVNLDKISHIKHSNRSRTRNYQQEESGKESIQSNKKYSLKKPWLLEESMSRFHINKVQKNYYKCKIIK